MQKVLGGPAMNLTCELLGAIRNGDASNVSKILRLLRTELSRNEFYRTRTISIKDYADTSRDSLLNQTRTEMDELGNCGIVLDKIFHMIVDNQNTLHFACLYGNAEIVKILLQPENQRICGYIEGVCLAKTPLMRAVESRNNEVVKILLLNGANTDQLECKKHVLEIALQQNSVTLIKLLIQFGADPLIWSRSDVALNMVIKQQSITTLRFLVSAESVQYQKNLTLSKTTLDTTNATNEHVKFQDDLMRIACSNHFFRGVILLHHQGYRINSHEVLCNRMVSLRGLDFRVSIPKAEHDSFLFLILFYGLDITTLEEIDSKYDSKDEILKSLKEGMADLADDIKFQRYLSPTPNFSIRQYVLKQMMKSRIDTDSSQINPFVVSEILSSRHPLTRSVRM